MSQSLSRWQAVVLGLVVVVAIGLAGFGLSAVAARQGLWAETVELTVGFPETHDVAPGTPVRIRGVDAGQVIAIDYPDHDGPGAAVTVRMKVEAKYAGRLYADATAQVYSTGLLGSKVIAIGPGTPTSGPLANGRLTPLTTPDLAAAAAKLGEAADEAKGLIHDVRTSNGTLAKLVQDDDLYNDLKGLAKDSRSMVQKADSAVGRVESEVGNVQRFVTDGRDTLKSVKQGTDAMQKLPLVRGYVEDATGLLVRPTWRREAVHYNAHDLFEPGTAILTDGGRAHLEFVVNWLKIGHDDKAEVVVAALCDPNDPGQTSVSAAELTRKQSEAVVEFVKTRGVHKIGWVSRRKMTPVGLGFGPPPAVERSALPPSYLQVLLFTPT